MLVEDEPALRVALTTRLEANGYTVVTAADGQAAINLVRKSLPDLILLDIMLPKLDGYKVCRMLKFDEKYSHIPIIMTSARAEEKDIATAAECKADAYYVKPVDSAALLRKIEELLEKEPAQVP